MANKFCRALPYSIAGTSVARDALFVTKAAYEFWCYCVNGGSSPTTPGGLAATTPTTLPAAFLENSPTILMASGTNGVTTNGSVVFTSAGASFSASMAGKYLVVWDPTTPTSTEDSIYQISTVPSATTLELIVNSGGSPDPSTLKPRLTARSGLRYRIVDMASSINAAGLATGQYMVWQMTPHSGNPGQANSQVQWFARTISTSWTQIGLSVSPGGTWTGSAFTDGTTEELPTTNSSGFFLPSNLSSTGFVTMIADKDYFILHVRSAVNSGSTGSGCHIEIPQRVYTQAQDPNPITLMVYGLFGLSSGSSTAGYGPGFVMRNFDNTTGKQRTLTRSLWGDITLAAMAFGGNMTDSRYSYYALSNKAITTEGLLSCVGTATQFSAARVRLRSVRFCSSAVPSYTRLGDQGQYLHLTNGVCVPWDNTILGYNLMPLGF